MRLAVLIETLWNVKHNSERFCFRSTTVLIETLWNVKKIRKPLILLHGNRINRNIVECKVSYATPQQIGASAVLIETLWNVKEKRERKVENAGYCINRNIVECKE